MNQRKAKKLRKMTNFHPGNERNYVQNNKRTDKDGNVVSATLVATDARRAYQTIKKEAV